MRSTLFSQQSKMDSLADFFDTRQEAGESAMDFRQKIISTIDSYRSSDQVTQNTSPAIQGNIEDYEYEVIGYDEALLKHMAQKSIALNTLVSGTIKEATELLTSELMQKHIPQTHVDGDGNVWQIRKK